MSVVEIAERLSPGEISPTTRDLWHFYLEGGLKHVLGDILYSRAVHLTRYEGLVAQQGLVEGEKVLDLGCGIGYGSRILEKQGGANSVIGVDIDSPTIACAQGRFGSERTSFVQADGQRMPQFGNASFSRVVCFEVIEHVSEPKTLLREVDRVLTDDGLLILSTPNREVNNPGTSIGDRMRDPYHLREYSKRELEALLGQHFEEVQILGQCFERFKGSRLMRRIRGLIGLTRLNKFSQVRPFGPEEQPLYFVAICKGKKEQK